MARRLLRKGDRIRLKVPLLSGWKGTATVVEAQLTRSDGVDFRKDGAVVGGFGSCACDHEVALLKDQAPDPRGECQPCPFCGCGPLNVLETKTPKGGTAYQIQCDDCLARGPGGMATEIDAYQAWNAGYADSQRWLNRKLRDAASREDAA
jgi:hypothetical protein